MTTRSAEALVALLGLLSLADPASAGARFEQLSVEQGLSQNSVHAIFQDRQGFLWVGTMDGLNLYDGHTFRTFKMDPEDPNTVSGDDIAWIGEDALGRICVYGVGGLDLYDPGTGTWSHLAEAYRKDLKTQSYVILGARVGKAGRIWLLGKNNEVFLFDPASGTRKRLPRGPLEPAGGPPPPIGGMMEDREGCLWLWAKAGLYRFDVRTGKWTSQRVVFSALPDAASLRVHLMIQDVEGDLWALTDTQLLHGRPTKAEWTSRAIPRELAEALSPVSLQAMLRDTSGDLWFGTGKGLFRMDPETLRWSRWGHDPSDPGGLSGDDIRALYEDRAGLLWIGTGGAGLFKYNPRRERWGHVRGTAGVENGLDSNAVFAFHEDRRGRLWVGTFGGGLDCWDRQRDRWSHHRHDPRNPNSISHDKVMAILEDREGILWVGTYGGGLNRYDPARDRWTRFRHDPRDPNSPGHDIISCLLEDRQGRLWVGSDRGGLNLLDRKTFRWKRYLQEDPASDQIGRNRVKVIHEDREGFLWIGTWGTGLIRFDPRTEGTVQYTPDPADPDSLRDLAVRAVLEDRKGRLWVGTAKGLSLLDRSTGRFTHFTTAHGLPNDFIYGILEDSLGRLWMSTNLGLACFDPEARLFRNYDQNDGLQGNEFNVGAYYRSPRGEMFFGGGQGFNAFVPEHIEANPHAPPVQITSFKSYESPLPVASGTVDPLRLSFRDTYLSFEFIALDFTNPARNRYAYRLEGFDAGWVQGGTRRFATYTNLPGGRYTFRVKGANSDGVWNEAGAALPFVLPPPPWKTWWAYGLYGLLALGGVAGYVRFKTLTQARELKSRERELEQERTVSDKLRNLDRLKDEFLANTSHELRTPLNGIVGLTESLIDGATGPLPEATVTNLSMVAAAGKRLTFLVNDLLDFSRLKNRDLALQNRPVDLRTLTDLVFVLLRPMAGQKGLELVNAIPAQTPLALADENRLQQVLYNLVGNAVKFTESGRVRVTAEAHGDRLEMAVSDTGIGIPADKLEAIFTPFEQADGSTARQYGGTGLGLSISRKLVELHGGTLRVESSPGAGSIFAFSLPLAEGEEVPAGPAPPRPGEPEVSRMRDSIEIDPAAARPTAELAPTPSEGPIRILIVDDEPVNLQVLANQLSLQRYTVLQAHNGPEALRLIEGSERFDLILLDIMMPKMSGYEVSRKIRETCPAHLLPIIMLTAKNQVEDLVEGLAAGANDYIAKPFSKHELLARIKTHLHLSKISAAYSRFVPVEFLEHLDKESILDVRLGDQVKKEMTILFSDIRSFTALSEKMTPEENFRFINAFLERMEPVIAAHDGFIDKYIGDAIMALFDRAPDDAVRAGIAMLERLEGFNGERRARGLEPVAIGIGVNTGSLMLGTVGGPGRMDSTVISDAVNLASRIEGLTKAFAVPLLVSDQSIRALHDPGPFLTRVVGRAKVKGKEEPVTVHEVFNADPEELRTAKRRTKGRFEEALRLFFAGDLEGAAGGFSECVAAAPGDAAAARYLESCRAGRAGPEPP
jgi:signal transduction histidine kinase/ligand-binding sensor domain-containing protein/class 3 adenylate cyclase